MLQVGTNNGHETDSFDRRLRIVCKHGDDLLRKAFRASGEAFKTDMTLDELSTVQRAIKENVHAQRHAEEVASQLQCERTRINLAHKELKSRADAIATRKIELATQMQRLGFITEAGEIIKPIAGRRTVRDVMAAIGKVYGYSIKELQSGSRMRDLSSVRQEIMWECHKIHGRSFPEIGRVLNRDHTTILHGVKMHEKRMK